MFNFESKEHLNLLDLLESEELLEMIIYTRLLMGGSPLALTVIIAEKILKTNFKAFNLENNPIRNIIQENKFYQLDFLHTNIKVLEHPPSFHLPGPQFCMLQSSLFL